ncbi:hypothetical protein [Streptomyces sp. SID5643]|uniref:hypothetical protein n=1 Tax=Streptomyces sp. SID5643 TaxID=2690307 RepID=UPI001368C877|nr:hypothetical protein [Streptomyces sp. SID5643]MZF84362.1 hypothetical protein [Streptomyces sp. SID5643]
MPQPVGCTHVATTWSSRSPRTVLACSRFRQFGGREDVVEPGGERVRGVWVGLGETAGELEVAIGGRCAGAGERGECLGGTWKYGDDYLYVRPCIPSNDSLSPYQGFQQEAVTADDGTTHTRLKSGDGRCLTAPATDGTVERGFPTLEMCNSETPTQYFNLVPVDAYPAKPQAPPAVGARHAKLAAPRDTPIFDDTRSSFAGTEQPTRSVTGRLCC